jgi:hypothetical protein
VLVGHGSDPFVGCRPGEALRDLEQRPRRKGSTVPILL